MCRLNSVESQCADSIGVESQCADSIPTADSIPISFRVHPVAAHAVHACVVRAHTHTQRERERERETHKHAHKDLGKRLE